MSAGVRHACSGGCHCGAVRFEVDVPVTARVTRCNCSICRQSGYIHLIVDREHFRLLQGEDLLTEYRFHTRTARHTFCRVCGIKSFYAPRSHPNGISVNLNCIDLDERIQVEYGEFDGRNWQRSISKLHRQLDRK